MWVDDIARKIPIVHDDKQWFNVIFQIPNQSERNISKIIQRKIHLSVSKFGNNLNHERIYEICHLDTGNTIISTRFIVPMSMLRLSHTNLNSSQYLPRSHKHKHKPNCRMLLIFTSIFFGLVNCDFSLSFFFVRIVFIWSHWVIGLWHIRSWFECSSMQFHKKGNNKSAKLFTDYTAKYRWLSVESEHFDVFVNKNGKSVRDICTNRFNVKMRVRLFSLAKFIRVCAKIILIWSQIMINYAFHKYSEAWQKVVYFSQRTMMHAQMI